MKNQLPYIVTSSFIVSGSDLNPKEVLQVSKILAIAKEHQDESILGLTGKAGSGNVKVDHYYLDFLGDATLSDVVTFRSYTYLQGNDLIEITLSAFKKNGKWEEPIANGSFIFTIQDGIPIQYGLS